MGGLDLQHSVEKYTAPLANFLECQRLLPVHRLDKITSGILLLSKSAEAHAYLVEQFRQRKIRKYYWTIVNGTPEPEEGLINIPLCEANINGRFRITLRPEKGQRKLNQSSTSMPAVTEYVTLKKRQNRALLEVYPHSGYKHQIRAHLGLGLNCPLLGDHKFSSLGFEGKPQKIHGDILQRLNIRGSRARQLPTLLHAKQIIIPHPHRVNRDIIIESKLPFYFNRIMGALTLSPNPRRVKELRRQR